MLKRTERHQSSLMNIRVNISLRKPGSSSKNVCRGHCLSFQFPFILGICGEALSAQSSQGLGVGGKEMSLLRCSEFLKKRPLSDPVYFCSATKPNEFEVCPFSSPLIFLLGHWTFVNNTDDHLNAVLALSNWAASTTIQSSRKGDPIKHV